MNKRQTEKLYDPILSYAGAIQNVKYNDRISTLMKFIFRLKKKYDKLKLISCVTETKYECFQ
jgi:hypothetical protein